jgi:hypothetical protein
MNQSQGFGHSTAIHSRVNKKTENFDSLTDIADEIEQVPLNSQKKAANFSKYAFQTNKTPFQKPGSVNTEQGFGAKKQSRFAGEEEDEDSENPGLQRYESCCSRKNQMPAF